MQKITRKQNLVWFDGNNHFMSSKEDRPVRLQLRAAVARSAETMDSDGHQSRYRSEEHTSELQSLMSISYAVFCLKKKHLHHHTYLSNTESNAEISVHNT